MNNAELIKALRDCAATWNTIDDCNVEECPFTGYGSMCIDTMLEAAANALEAAERLLDQNVKRCDALRKQLRESHKSYEQRISELEEEHNKTVTAIFGEEQLWWENRCKELEAQLLKEGVCEAKKPKTVKETEYSFYCDCPTCGGRLISNVDGEWCAGSFDRFCRMCGQKIDWSEYCGWSNKPYCGADMRGEHDGET